MAYNYLDVFRLENGKKETLPFNPINRAMGAISYRPLHNWFVVDGNVHWFDRQKLPSTLNANGEAGPGSSKPYAVYTVQVTVKWKKTELYGGVENIFDFRQRQPIAGWQQPFGPNFDTGSVWGPTRGREFYIGLRWKPEA
jgi:outer membrane receptor for ferrienterochelin and colicin